jgi:hypothetical protein
MNYNPCTFCAVSYNDLLGLEAPKDIPWTDIETMGNFINIYDWDRLSLNADLENVLKTRIVLCAGPLPCALSLLGTGVEGSSLQRVGNGSLICLESTGCSGLNISKVKLICSQKILEFPALSAPLEIEGAALSLENSSVLGCFSQKDGGSVRAYGGAYVQVREMEVSKHLYV